MRAFTVSEAFNYAMNFWHFSFFDLLFRIPVKKVLFCSCFLFVWKISDDVTWHTELTVFF